MEYTGHVQTYALPKSVPGIASMTITGNPSPMDVFDLSGKEILIRSPGKGDGLPGGPITVKIPVRRKAPNGAASGYTLTGTQAAPNAGITCAEVAAGAWYETAVSTRTKMGVITGYQDGTFLLCSGRPQQISIIRL